MSDLLPSNATAQERALTETVSRVSDVPVVVREMWNPDTVPVDVLPWLAWAFSVDDWDSSWTTDQKRETIKQSVVSQRIKGTIGAVKKQLFALGYDITILEWFKKDPSGIPYTFDTYITASQFDLTENDFSKILQVINTNKNLRSHMAEIQLVVMSLSTVNTGIACLTGNEITLTNYTRSVSVINDYNVILI